GVELTNEIIRSQAERLGVAPTELIGGPLPTLSPQLAARETAPGNFSFTVPSGVAVEVIASVGPDSVPAELTWTSNLSLWPLTEEAETQTLDVGTPVVGTVSGYRVGIPFQVELKAGQKVKLLASSPQGDVALAITRPGRKLTSFDLNSEESNEEVKIFDDSDKGLFGLDVSESFTATDAGLYHLAVQNNEVSPVAFRVEVAQD
ncbi:MAG TPA: PPC domain-containing protein, partial [Microthrixaceae bacterium]|nr:PPC domain-containing protein [Microthrixaceae bacterium]